MAAIAGPQPRIVGREIAAVQAFERWDEAHPEIVTQAERGAARLHELLEEPSGGPEPHAEVEQPAACGPLDEDAVPTDLPGSAAVHRDGKAAVRHANTLNGRGSSDHGLLHWCVTPPPQSRAMTTRGERDDQEDRRQRHRVRLPRRHAPGRAGGVRAGAAAGSGHASGWGATGQDREI